MSTPNQNIVLVVDDSPDTVGAINEILYEAGFTVLVALDGKQALKIALRMKPDVILLDALMPEMSGFDTCRQLKMEPSLSHVPVIFMTGLSELEHIEEALASGGVDFINKPVQAKVLVARLRVHLANARLTQSARQALDSMGHYTFSIDSLGKILWATPHTKSMLAVAGATPSWIKESMPQQLKLWVSSAEANHQELALKGLGQNLRVQLIGSVAGDEFLLKLINENQPDAINKLKKHFEVTDREAEVLLWIAHGKTNREIGQILSMSPRTVNKHLEQIYKKLGVENRTSAAARAIRYIFS